MRVILITLSGDPDKARSILNKKYPNADITNLPRGVLDTGDLNTRLRLLRETLPEIFAVMTESLAWQYGQDALMLFGALAGARQSLILDARGELRSGGRMDLIAGSPLRIVRALARGKYAVRRAGNILSRLQRHAAMPVTPLRAKQNSKKRAIAYLRATPAAGSHPGGATSHINGVVKALLALNSQITFASNDEIAGLDTSTVLFQKFAPDPAIMPRSAFDLHNGMAFSKGAANLIADSPPDFIYQRYCRFSWAGVEASLRSGVPLFLEYNGSEVWIGKNWDGTGELELLERCERLNLSAARRIFVISEVERSNLLKAGVPGEKIVVNPNGVDVEEFRPGIDGHAFRDELGLQPNAKLVGFVGTFGPWHGVLALAQAVALIPKNAGIHFLFVGDGSLRAEVEQMLRRRTRSAAR